MEKIKSSLKFFIGLPLTIISFIFIGKILYDSRTSILDSILNVSFIPLTIGVFFFILFFLAKSFAWTMILKNRNHMLNTRNTIYLYSLSEIKRFVPLFVMSYVSRVANLSGKVSKKESFKSIGIEAILLSLSSLTVGIPGLLFLVSKNFPWVNTGLLALPILLVVVSIIYFKNLRNTIFNYFDVYLTLVLAWFLYGLANYFIALSLNFIDPSNFVNVVSLFSLSWLAGYLFFLSPMGLGVREISTTYLLSFFVPMYLATAIAVFSRIVMIISEIVYLAIVSIVNKIHPKSRLLKIDIQILILSLLAFMYFSYFSFMSLQKHNSVLTGRFDLGNMTQTVWNTANGNFFMLTNPDGTEIVSRLAVHSDFILVLFAPFYWIWPHPGVLLLGQSLILSLGAFFVYLIANQILKNKNLSLVLSLSYILNFWLHEQNLFDFHAVSLATTFLLATFYFLLGKRYLLFLLFLFLAVITKENIFLIAGLFGLYIAFINKKIVWGLLLFLFSFACFFYLSSYAIPEARGETHFALGSYKYLGSSTEEIVVNIMLKPGVVINQILNGSTLDYIHNHLVTTGYLAILSPLYLIFTIPELAIYLLSSNFEYRSYQYHFGAAIIPFIYIATIYSIKFLVNRFTHYNLLKVLTYYVLLTSLLSFYYYSPVVGAKNADLALYRNSDNSRILKHLDLIPQNAKVAASNNIAAHLSHREYIFVLPLGIEEAEYIVLFKENEYVLEKINKERYELIREDKDFFIYKRIFPSS